MAQVFTPTLIYAGDIIDTMGIEYLIVYAITW